MTEHIITDKELKELEKTDPVLAFYYAQIEVIREFDQEMDDMGMIPHRDEFHHDSSAWYDKHGVLHAVPHKYNEEDEDVEIEE